MKKIALAVLIIGSFILFSLIYNNSNNAILPPSATVSAGSSERSASSATPVPSTTAAPSALYKDGMYTGSVADAQWGNIQIQAVIQNGRITNITFLQYPNERDRSVRINSEADPQLVSEAIQVQSANVDTITGATDTSEAFIQSLTNALSQAQA